MDHSPVEKRDCSMCRYYKEVDILPIVNQAKDVVVKPEIRYWCACMNFHGEVNRRNESDQRYMYDLNPCEVFEHKRWIKGPYGTYDEDGTLIAKRRQK